MGHRSWLLLLRNARSLSGAPRGRLFHDRGQFGPNTGCFMIAASSGQIAARTGHDHGPRPECLKSRFGHNGIERATLRGVVRQRAAAAARPQPDGHPHRSPTPYR